MEFCTVLRIQTSGVKNRDIYHALYCIIANNVRKKQAEQMLCVNILVIKRKLGNFSSPSWKFLWTKIWDNTTWICIFIYLVF